MTHTTVIWRSFAIEEELTITGVTYRKITSVNAAPNSPGPGACRRRRRRRRKRRRREALTHRAAVNQMPSHLCRPDAIYFSFSAHCWHTVIAGPSLPSNKIRADIFPIFCRGGGEEAPPLSVPGGMIERSLHCSPCLTAHRLSFLKTLRSVCVCVCVCWRRMAALHCGYKTHSDEQRRGEQ